MAGRIRRHWKGLLTSAVLVVAVVVVGGPFLYIHLIEGDQPAALTLNDVPSSSNAVSSAVPTTPTTSSASSAAPSAAAAADSVDGTWTVGTGSQAGYRVPETLAGQSTTAVGRTSAVTGSLTISATSVTAASFTVQVAKITSDQSQRDGQFSGRIMNTSRYPTATFRLTQPIELGTVPADGATITASATGDLTLHGTTRSVTFTVSAKRSGATIAVNGTITVAFADYGIDNPSVSGLVSVGNSGTIEFLLVTAR